MATKKKNQLEQVYLDSDNTSAKVSKPYGNDGTNPKLANDLDAYTQSSSTSETPTLTSYASTTVSGKAEADKVDGQETVGAASDTPVSTYTAGTEEMSQRDIDEQNQYILYKRMAKYLPQLAYNQGLSNTEKYSDSSMGLKATQNYQSNMNSLAQAYLGQEDEEATELAQTQANNYNSMLSFLEGGYYDGNASAMKDVEEAYENGDIDEKQYKMLKLVVNNTYSADLENFINMLNGKGAWNGYETTGEVVTNAKGFAKSIEEKYGEDYTVQDGDTVTVDKGKTYIYYNGRWYGLTQADETEETQTKDVEDLTGDWDYMKN